MPTALEELFVKTKSQNRAVLIGYIPAGFPNQKSSKKILKAMIDGGIDAVEIGYHTQIQLWMVQLFKLPLKRRLKMVQA